MAMNRNEYATMSGEQNPTIQRESLQVLRDKNIEQAPKNIGVNPRLWIFQNECWRPLEVKDLGNYSIYEDMRGGGKMPNTLRSIALWALESVRQLLLRVMR